MKGAVKITVTPKYKRMLTECDHTGRRLTPQELQAQRANPFVGTAKVEFATEGMLLIATIAKIWRNKDSMGVTFEYDAVKVGDEVLEWVERACIQAMHGVETSEWFG